MRKYLLIVPAVVVLLVFLVIPYIDIIFISLHPAADDRPYGSGFTLRNYVQVLTDGYLVHQTAMTLWIVLVTTCATLVLGFPVAWFMAHSSARARAIQQGIVLMPLLVGIVVRSYGWTVILGNNGILNRLARDIGLTRSVLPLMYNSLGIVIALTHVFLPFMILPIFGTIRSLDPALFLAGRSLGASPAITMRRVILPLTMPGIQSGCVLVFILSVSAYVTPMLIGGMRVKTMPMTVVNTLIDAFQWPFGAAQALVLSAIGALIVLVFFRLTPLRWSR
ncbi:ABC transporter permease [Komagataeibacter rhaeticus]|uniref:ABC transporter permease n=1 Tax=Komagataeibacter rhaeticus TaxID=215221 RepID=UPI001A47037F|nr:ABC transporter permease [Komagataeibacter rhaeticus]MBL7239227.1 ABC transporter permease [Komagataeibacter rhaeticus]